MQGIYNYYNKKNGINLPPAQIALKKKIWSIIGHYVSSKGEEPSEKYIADELNDIQDKKRYTEEDIKKLLNMYKNIHVSSLNVPLSNDGESDLSRIIATDNCANLNQDLSNQLVVENIRMHIDGLELEDKTRQVLEGILYDNLDFNRIAKKMGIRREQVKQRYFKGLRKLVSSLKGAGISIDPIN